MIDVFYLELDSLMPRIKKINRLIITSKTTAASRIVDYSWYNDRIAIFSGRSITVWDYANHLAARWCIDTSYVENVGRNMREFEVGLICLFVIDAHAGPDTFTGRQCHDTTQRLPTSMVHPRPPR